MNSHVKIICMCVCMLEFFQWPEVFEILSSKDAGMDSIDSKVHRGVPVAAAATPCKY